MQTAEAAQGPRPHLTSLLLPSQASSCAVCTTCMWRSHIALPLCSRGQRSSEPTSPFLPRTSRDWPCRALGMAGEGTSLPARAPQPHSGSRALLDTRRQMAGTVCQFCRDLGGLRSAVGRCGPSNPPHESHESIRAMSPVWVLFPPFPWIT